MADLPQNVIDARTAADAAATSAGQYASAVPTIRDELQKQVNKLYNDNQDVLGLFNQGVTNLVNATPQSYGLFNNLTDPYARAKAAGDWASTQTLPALNAAGLVGQRMGSISDTVQKGTNAFTAQATAAENAAQLSRQKYQDILNEFQVKQAQDNADRQFALEQQKLANSNATTNNKAQVTAFNAMIAKLLTGSGLSAAAAENATYEFLRSASTGGQGGADYAASIGLDPAFYWGLWNKKVDEAKTAGNYGVAPSAESTSAAKTATKAQSSAEARLDQIMGTSKK